MFHIYCRQWYLCTESVQVRRWNIVEIQGDLKHAALLRWSRIVHNSLRLTNEWTIERIQSFDHLDRFHDQLNQSVVSWTRDSIMFAPLSKCGRVENSECLVLQVEDWLKRNRHFQWVVTKCLVHQTRGSPLFIEWESWYSNLVCTLRDHQPNATRRNSDLENANDRDVIYKKASYKLPK